MSASKRALPFFTSAAIVLVSILLIAAIGSSSINNSKWSGTASASAWHIDHPENFVVTYSEHSFSVTNKTNKNASFSIQYTQRVLVKNNVGHYVNIPGMMVTRSWSHTVGPGATYTSNQAASNPLRSTGFTQDFFKEDGKQYRVKAITHIQPLTSGFTGFLEPIARHHF